MTRTSRSLAAVVLGLLVAVAGIHAQTSDRAGVMLQTAIQTEMVDGDLGKAIELYQEIIVRFGQERPVAATALLHLGQSYEKLGEPEAHEVYQRVVRDYADQRDAAQQAQARLAAANSNAQQVATDALQAELLWTTSDSGIPAQGGVSPDGRLMTYVDWSDRGNLAIRDFATGESRRLTHTADNGSGENGGNYAGNSRMSPDGGQVLYSWARSSPAGETGELRLLSVEGDQGEPRKVWSPADGRFASVQDWFPSGDRVVAVVSGPYGTPGAQQIITVSTDDGQVQQIRSVEWGRDLTVRVSPDGRYLAYTRAASRDDQALDVFVIAVDGSSESAVVQHAANDRLVAWGPGGRHLLFSSDRIGLPGLWAQRVQDGTPAGEPQLLVSNFSGYPLGVTRDGKLHYAVRVNQMRLKTAQLDFTTGKFLRQPVDAVERFLGSNYWPTFSPDGETFAYVSTRPGGTTPIVLRSLKTGEERDLLPLGLQEVRNLRWRPGGPITVIGRDDRGRRGRFVVDVATGQTRPLGGPWRFLTPDGTEGFLTPDGTQILHKDRSKNPAAIYAYSVADGSFHTLPGVFGGERFSLSPHGQWIATVAPTRDYPAPNTEIRLDPTTGGDGDVLWITDEGEPFYRWTTWTPDSSALVVLKQEPQAGEGMRRLWVVPVDGSAPVATELVYEPRAGSTPGLIIHPDGTRIFYHEGNSSQQFWALHNLGLE